MSGNSVGRIDLDLALNSRGFNRQLSGIAGLAKRAGAVLAGAFAVKGIVNFGKECVKLGSDLTEVQNMVDVAFGSMSAKIENFAQTSINNFGVSELAAKSTAANFMAMGKSMGLAEEAASDMAVAATGLTGDIASFYNISQDLAMVRLRGVWTGETEALKELGVVMTETNLKEYALANGITKSYNAMNQAERVTLRYKYVTEALGHAQGDFARTSGTWANQVRVLSLQFDQFKATIGQGLINAFTPVIQVINTLMAKLMALANAFKSFTAMIFGDQTQSGGAAAETMNGLSDSVEGVGDATAGTAKQIKKSLAGFDELNVLSAPDSGGNGGAGGLAPIDVPFPVQDQDNTVLSEANRQLDGMMDRLRELAQLFQTGFQIGFGDMDVSGIELSLGQVRASLDGVFNDKDVKSAAKQWVNSAALSLGKGAGALTSVGATLAQNLLGGMERFLADRGGALKSLLVSALDVSTETNDLRGRMSTVIADILSVFGGDNAQRVTAAILQMFTEPFAHVLLLAQKLGRDLLNCIVQPLEDNAAQIKSVIDNSLGTIASVFETIADTVSYAFETMQVMYDEHVAPMLLSFSEGISHLLGVFLDAWEAHIQPVLDDLANKFREVVEEHVQPMINDLIEFIGKVCDALKLLWEKWIQPLATYIIEKASPLIGGAIEAIGETFNGLLTTASEVIRNITKALGGLVDFITGVLTGDWDKAWNGLGDIVSGVFDGLVELVKAPLNLVIGLVNKLLGAVETGVNGIIKMVNKLSFDVPDWVPGLGGKTFGFNLRTMTIPRIPALAQGGYVRANTPQLAMIGDNRTQGEVVAPEGKLAELLKAAVSAGGDNSKVVSLLTSILELMKSGVVMVVNEQVFARLTLDAVDQAAQSGCLTMRV